MTQATSIYEYTLFSRTLPVLRRNEKAPLTEDAIRAFYVQRVEQFLKQQPEAVPHQAALIAYATKFEV